MSAGFQIISERFVRLEPFQRLNEGRRGVYRCNSPTCVCLRKAGVDRLCKLNDKSRESKRIDLRKGSRHEVFQGFVPFAFITAFSTTLGETFFPFPVLPLSYVCLSGITQNGLCDWAFSNQPVAGTFTCLVLRKKAGRKIGCIVTLFVTY